MEITLKAGGERTKVEEAEAKEIAERFQTEIGNQDNAVVTTVDLSCRAWPRPSLECLRPVLTQVVATVTTLKIDDIIASLPTEEGLQSLEFFADVFSSSNVVEIDLADNALGSRGDQVLLPLFRLPSLAQLSLENCGMSKEVTESLLTSISNKPLTHLKLGRNQIGPEGAAHVQSLIAECPTLEAFYYNGCRPLKQGTRFILQGLATMAEAIPTTALVELNFHDCTFGDDEDADEENASAIDNLTLVLLKSPSLKILNLQDGEIGAEGLESILQALVNSGAAQGLVSLALGGCELGPDGAHILAKFFNDSQLGQLLEEVKLDTNEFGDEGVDTLIPALCVGAQQLKSLDLETNEIEKAGTKTLIQNKLPNLQVLNVLDNMDIPAKWGAKLTDLYDTVKIDDDLEEADEDDEEEEQMDDLADQLASTNI